MALLSDIVELGRTINPYFKNCISRDSDGSFEDGKTVNGTIFHGKL